MLNTMQAHVRKKYPPILMVHGAKDNDVPSSKSADMAKELARKKVPHELITIPEAGHGLTRRDKKLVANARASALAFIRTHLGDVRRKEKSQSPGEKD